MFVFFLALFSPKLLHFYFYFLDKNKLADQKNVWITIWQFLNILFHSNKKMF